MAGLLKAGTIANKRLALALRKAPEWISSGYLASLKEVLECLGPGVLEVIAAPRGVEVEVTGPILFDPTDGISLEPGALVLGIGVAPPSEEALRLIDAAGSACAAAVCFKLSRSVPSGITEAARSAHIAVLAVRHEMTWSQLHTLLRTAVASAGQLHDGDGDGIGDLFALANAIASMVGGATVIEDTQSRLLAYSTLDQPVDDARMLTILGRRAWSSKQTLLREITKRLWSTDAPIDVSIPGGLPRQAIAVRAGGEILGAIWTIQPERGRLHLHDAALVEASRIAALHLIRFRAAQDLDSQMRSEILRSVLEANADIEVASQRLGIKPYGSFAILAFDLIAVDHEELAFRQHRVARAIAGFFDTMRRRWCSCVLGGIVYVLIPMTQPDERSLRQIAFELAARVKEKAEPSINVGIGSMVSSLGMIQISRVDADHVLRVLAEDRRLGKVISIDEVRSRSMLLQTLDLLARGTVTPTGKVARIDEYDMKHHSAYLPTLESYLNHFGDVARCAQSLQLHSNTLRYRLRRLSDLFDIHLDDRDERLAIEIELRLRERFQRPPPLNLSGDGPG